MFSFFKRKNSKKNTNSIDNVQNNNDASKSERDEKITMVQCYQEKSKSADHNIQQVPSNKCSRNIKPSGINDREQKTSQLDGIIGDKNKTQHNSTSINEQELLRLHSDSKNIGKCEVNGNQSKYNSEKNGDTTSHQKDGDIGQENRCDLKYRQEEKLAEFGDKRINGVLNSCYGDNVKLFRDQIANKDVKTGKEVINLLLPEKNYKKVDSISKTAVQNLFDIMGGGKKRKNKYNKFKSPETSNRKSWSFNGNKLKTDVVSDNDNEPKQPEKNELQRSSSVPSANICSKYQTNNAEAVNIKSRETIEKDAWNKCNDTQQQSMPTVCDANKSLESTERGVTESTSAHSTCHNKNKRQPFQETPAVQHKDKACGEKERETSDELQTDIMTSDFIGNCAKSVGSRPEHCEDLVVLHSNSTSSKCDTEQTCHDDSADIVKSLLLDKYSNIKIYNTKHKTGNDYNSSSLRKNSNNQTTGAEGDIYKTINNHNSAVEGEYSDDQIIMGAADSRQGGGRESGNKVDKSLLKDENITGNSDYVVSECGRTQGEAENVTQGEKTVIITSQVDINVLNETNLQNNNICTELPDNCAKVTENSTGCATMEEMDNSCSSNKVLGNEDSEGKRLKNILKETADCEAKASVKKHVTFHKIIHFDDGDNLEDDDSISFASLDDIDDDDMEFDLNKVDNYEVVFPENDEPTIRDGGNSKTNDFYLIGNDSQKKIDNDTKHICTNESENLSKFKSSQENRNVEISELFDDVENNENLGLEINEEKILTTKEETENTKKAFNKIIEVKEISSSEEEEDEESESEEEETCEESISEDESETGESSSVSDDLKKEKVIFDSDKVVEEVRKQEAVWEVEDKEDDSAYAELLRVVERQLMRGLAGQEGRLADLQERAAALHRVQSEVCSARKEAELVRQKLRHVEGDLAATRTRNCQLVEQLEARAEAIRQAERRADELAEEVMRLQQKLDQIQPGYDELKGLADKLKKEREIEKKAHEQALANEQALREERERSWKAEFEKLRSQGAESEELLLADCEWKLRDVQKAASERCARAEGKLAELQKTADAKCAEAEKQITELRIEMSSLRTTSLEQQRALRQSAQQTGALEAAKNTLEQESRRLKTLLNMEMDKAEVIKAQHARELDEKDRRMMIRLAEEAKKAELQGRMSRRAEECTQHEKALREANRKIQDLKSTLAKKESQFAESLEKAEARADWQILEIRRSLDKAELKYSEALEKLQEQYSLDTERITAESEKRIKELEIALSAQTCSSRTTLELVRERLQAEHADSMLKLKEQHRIDMENQWEVFTNDKEQCLERMKVECMMEGEEEREKRDKQLLKNIDELKHELESTERDVGSLRLETKKANEARASAERKLSEAQAACVAREIAVRSEAARLAEVEKKEARDTIEHLTKKCACLTNLFEDMRSRWQQAPGEAAQLRKALQDEKARAQALRRQLDALSRDLGVTAETVGTGGDENNYRPGVNRHREDVDGCAGVKKLIVEKDGGIHTVIKSSKKKKTECENKQNLNNECDNVIGENNELNKCEFIKNSSLVTGNPNIHQNVNETGKHVDQNNVNSTNELGNMWTLVKKGGLRKRGRRTILSPPRQQVELPAVTVPLRIRQFDPNRKKKI